ncbi:nucleotide exchange factor GrpE [Candidatus Bipolaricaulota bacterium]|nr:nucleotide exchange factor GrpE [Candidatus Bipolaricaulota bacterium]
MSAKEEKIRNSELQPEMEELLESQYEGSIEPELSTELRLTIDRLQRLQAEFENYKKRASRDALLHEQRITDRLILDFLPLYDNLERAFESFSSDQDVETFVTGIELIFGQFNQLLENKGVTPIDTHCVVFNPELHEAMLSIPSDVARNMIIEEFTPGYTRDERVLRPSRVSVSQGPALSEEDQK